VLPVLQAVAVCLDEPQKVLLWISREAASQRRSLTLDLLAFGGHF
jgi:hypothetical protein